VATLETRTPLSALERIWIIHNDVMHVTGLRPGPYWASFEQFRVRGVDGLRDEVGPDQVGRLTVKGDEFVIMRSKTFSGLYGTALEIDRLSNQLHLIRQAVQLLQESRGSAVAVQHVADLVVQLPDLAAHRFGKAGLVFDDDEQLQPSDYASGDMDFELDPARVRPTWSRG
jgi:hypothetical protein